MICGQCKNEVPHHALVCPTCTSKRSAEAYARFQLEPLRRVMAGTGRLTLRRIAPTWHVQMFGFDHTYCGLAIVPMHKSKRLQWYEFEDDPGPCEVCKSKVCEAMEQACHASA